MQRARHGQKSRHSHRPAATLRSPARRPRVVAMIAVAAAGLAVAFWLPTRSDSASATENGQRASSNWRHDGHGNNRDRRHARERASASADPSLDPSADPSGVPSGSPSAEPPSSEPPTTAPPTTEPAATPPTTAPPTTEPTTAPTTVPPTTPPTDPPTTIAPAAKAWAPFTIYESGRLVTFGGETFKVLAAHTSLPGWEPSKLPALFKVIG